MADGIAQEFEIDSDCEEQINDFDDGEQNLEDEARKMAQSWDRDQLMKEVIEERERAAKEKERRESDYYDGKTNFSDLAADMEPIDGGLVLVKVLESNPDGKQITANTSIYFDKVGFLEHNDLPFESTTYEGKPCQLSLVEGPIIPGLLQGLLRLREGESANILIKPQMAYGLLGCPPIIPENASLYYYVKIFKVWSESELNHLIQLGDGHFAANSVDDILPLVDEHKTIANSYLKDGLLKEAIVRYKAAVKCLDGLSTPIESRSDASRVMVVLLQNLAVAYNKAGMHKSATKAAKRVLSIDPSSIKAYYQLSKARISLSDFPGAQKWIERAKKISPNDRCFDHLKLELDAQYRNEKKKRDDIMFKMSRACV